MNRRMMMAAKTKAAPRLPVEFQEVEWIQSDGNSYLRSGITMTKNLIFGIEYRFASVPTSLQRVFGYIESGSRISATAIFSTNTSIQSSYCYGNTDATYKTGKTPTDWVLLYLEPNKQEVNGVVKTTNTITLNPTSLIDIPIFTRWEGWTSGNGLGAISPLLQVKRFWSDNIEAYPCYRKSDGVIGMYDVVGNRFITNAGSGSFIKGADVL